MSLEIYVGNYPTTFTSDDLFNLFQDFEGIELLRSNKNNNKCFSFFRCLDESQIVDIVTTMHDIDVCGRNLIVRATNIELQTLIVESLQENDVLDKHPRNTHHSHLGVNQSPNGINVKDSGDEVVSDFPIGVRFINPRLQSSHIEKKRDCDSVDQPRSSSWSNEYRHKSPTQLECLKESIPHQQNLPIRGIGISNASGQSLSQDSNKHNTKVQNFPDEETSFPKHRQFENRNPGGPNFVDRITQGNSQFINPRFRSPHLVKNNDYGDHQKQGSHVSAMPHIKPTQEVFDNDKKSCQSSSSSPGTGVPKHNTSYRNSALASHEPDVMTQHFPDGGASIQKYEQQRYESSKPGKQNFGNHAKESNSYKKKSANESSNSDKQNFVYHGNESSHSSKQNLPYRANGSSNSGRQTFANRATESHSYDAKGGDLSHSGSCSTSDYQRDTHYNILNEDKDIEAACQSESLDEPECENDLFYVSVVNFPLRTTISDMYSLFQDFDPYNIIMICNFPTKDRRPTEAILCFQSMDQATDAIMNFDNTFYCGRSLVVTDATDQTMVPALLSMNSKDV